jgi:undecaprenyl-diphosphatase
MSAILSADEKIFLWLNGLVGHVPMFDNLMSIIGDDFFIITCFALSMIALWFGARRLEQRKLNQKTLVATSIAVALTCLWIYIFRISDFLYRPRPSEDYDITVLTYLHEGSSFPSETAAVAFTFATAVWIGNRKAGIVIGILAILWCFGRIYCGTHYPLDIVAGALIGILTAFIVSKLLQIISGAPNSIIRFFEWLHLA